MVVKNSKKNMNVDIMIFIIKYCLLLDTNELCGSGIKQKYKK